MADLARQKENVAVVTPPKSCGLLSPEDMVKEEILSLQPYRDNYLISGGKSLLN